MTARFSLILEKTRGHRQRLQLTDPMNRIVAVAFILFCFEIGLFLMFVPWSALWEHNMLLAYSIRLSGLLLNTFVRGKVSGLGIIDVFLGLSDRRHFWKSLRLVNRPTTTE